MNNGFYIRVLPTLLIVTISLLLEGLLPKKKRVHSRRVRWVGNLTIIGVNRVVVWAVLLLPFSLERVEVPNLFDLLGVKGITAYIKGFILLDITIYLQHRLFHVVTPFWRMHLMHHTDRDLDFTSALRFHPFEIITSMGIKLLAVLLVGIDPMTLLVFETATSTFAIFNHSNFRIHPKLERILRWVIITPDLHRVHHSVKLKETNSNYGTIFVWWDRLFGSFVAEPELGQDGMIIGVPGYKEKKLQYLHWMLITPFSKGDKSV